MVLGYGLDDRGSRVRFPVGVEISLFTTASRTALGPTQPPIQWVPGALSLGIKRPGREADQSPPSSAEVKNAWRYTSTPSIRLHVVFPQNSQSTVKPGTIPKEDFLLKCKLMGHVRHSCPTLMQFVGQIVWLLAMLCYALTLRRICNPPLKLPETLREYSATVHTPDLNFIHKSPGTECGSKVQIKIYNIQNYNITRWSV
jgi:hypothetical protein